MAAAGQALLPWLETVLPPRDPVIGCDPVLEEVEPATGPDNPAEFGERERDIGDHAQGERGERAVTAPVLERQELRVGARIDDLDPGVSPPALGQAAGDTSGFNGVDHLDLRGEVVEVEPRAEADLDDPS